MNIEELKLIIEAFGGLSDNAYTAFLTWLIYQYTTAFLVSLTILSIAYIVYCTIRNTIGAAEHLKEISNILGDGYYGAPSRREINQIKQHIEKLVKLENK